MNWWVKDSTILKFVSLLIALILWVLVLSGRNFHTSKRLLLRLNTPQTMVVSNTVPHYIQYHFRGPKVILNTLEKRLENLIVDLQNYEAGEHRITFHEEMLGQLPVGVHVTAIEPSAITVLLEPVQERVLAVVPQLVGEPATGYVLGLVETQPRKVVIRGAASRLKSLTTVRTEPIHLDGLTASKSIESQVVYEFKSGILREERDPIKVSIEIREKPQKQRFAGVAVEIRDAPNGARWALSQQEVEVTLEGPRSVLTGSDFDAGRIKAYVKWPPGDETLKKRTLSVHIEVPNDLLIVGLEPKTITVTRIH